MKIRVGSWFREVLLGLLAPVWATSEECGVLSSCESGDTCYFEARELAKLTLSSPVRRVSSLIVSKYNLWKHQLSLQMDDHSSFLTPSTFICRAEKYQMLLEDAAMQASSKGFYSEFLFRVSIETDTCVIFASLIFWHHSHLHRSISWLSVWGNLLFLFENHGLSVRLSLFQSPAKLLPDPFEKHTFEHFWTSQPGMSGSLLKFVSMVTTSSRTTMETAYIFVQQRMPLSSILCCVSKATYLMLRQDVKHTPAPAPQNFPFKKGFLFWTLRVISELSKISYLYKKVLFNCVLFIVFTHKTSRTL